MTPLGEFGPPPDAAAWCALVLALLVAVLPRGALAGKVLSRTRHAVLALSLLAGALSAAYVVTYLRGGPRIIDATSYFLEARALAEGHVQFPIVAPSGSFRGRFLLPSDDAGALAVIFPPGYPALLALGFLAGAPLAVGPLLAVLLVLVTADVAQRIFGDDRITLLAAALSTACAVLRYHTADTMSHGFAALLLSASVALALRATSRAFVLAGLAGGVLFATRPASGAVALGLVVFAARRSPRQAGLVALGAAVPVALFFAHQHAATGSAFSSTQLAYYGLSDGPPGCFRYGFGAGIGCRFEHGDFVAARLGNGFGFTAALLTTLRRLKMHLADAGNVELYAPLVVYAATTALRDVRARLAGAAFFGIVLAYVPFYFDGNYPGGGARFFADALPLEHVLLAGVLVRAGLHRFAVPVALAGFALHTSYDHRSLAEREGGAPMFEQRVLDASGVSRGIVFVDTDHGFNLGHAPGGSDPSRGVVVARRRGDAHDVLLWESLGRPPAFDYVFAAAGGGAGGAPRVSPRRFDVPGDVLRFEAEAEWPALAVARGSAYPDFPACASARRALALHPSSEALRVRLEVVVPRAAQYRFGTGWVLPPDGGLAARVTAGGVTWTPAVSASKELPCAADEGPWIPLADGSNFVEITVTSAAHLDFMELRAEAPVAAVPHPHLPP